MKLLYTLFLLTLTISVFAQRNSGFKIGYNIGWVSSTLEDVCPNYNNIYEMNTINKLYFGYSWNIKLTGRYSIQTDLIYNIKGSETTLKDSYIATLPPEYSGYIYMGNDYGIACLSLPITLNYMITPNLFGELGGEFSLAPLNGPDDNFDFGIAAGMGYCTKYGDISFRYIHGLTPHERTYSNSSYNYCSSDGASYSSPITEYSFKYRTFQISLTIPVFKYIKKAMHRE